MKTPHSPAMFHLSADADSLNWLGSHDERGELLNGGKTYKLTVSLPVPAKWFWSVTVYDVINRSPISTDQNKAALRSLFELRDKSGSSLELYFGPAAPDGKQDVWIKTLPGRGWFMYFRIYGHEPAVFDGTWKPGYLEEVKGLI